MSTESSIALAAATAGEAGRTSLLRSLARSPMALVSMLFIVGIAATGLLGPWLAPRDESQVVLAEVNSAPGGTYLLGGDASGRDILSRLIASIDAMLFFTVIATVTAVVIGVAAGLLAGYVGRAVDTVLSWIFDVVLAVPGIIVLIAVYAAFGASSTAVSAVVFGLLMTVGFYRLVRALTLSVKNELYVDAAKVSGLSVLRILSRHVLYVIRAPIIILSAYAASNAIGVQAGLQFLGIGDPNAPSWGAMLQDAFLNLYVNPLALLWPGLALTITTAALVLFGNSFRDVLEGPRRTRRTRRTRSTRSPRRRPSTSATAAASAAGAREPAPGDVLLALSGLSIGYPTATGVRTVVEDVGFEVRRGEVVGLVGESGAGKSQTAFATLGLLASEATITSGSIRLAGLELVGLPESSLAGLRGSVVGYVPQEPISNLDPTFTVGSQLVYGIRAVTGMSKRDARQRVLELLVRVGIPEAQKVFRSYPHQISGGMAQRALIAGAVACEPQLLVADEPTTALDVTVQAEILDLLRDLQKERGMGMLIVTHNFGVVADLCDRVVVMRGGRVVEQGDVRSVFADPQHDYTRSLLGSIIADDEVRGPPAARLPIGGERT